MAKKEYDIFYEDECHFKHTLTTTRSWYLKGSKPEVPMPAGYDKFSIYGAVNSNKGWLITMSCSYFNTASFKRFIEKLLAEQRRKPTTRKILLVLDNVRYHKAKKLRGYFEDIKDKLELLFLPPYSPDLNPIEMVWRQTRRDVTHNRYFESLEAQRQALNTYWNKLEKGSEKLRKLTAFY